MIARRVSGVARRIRGLRFEDVAAAAAAEAHLLRSWWRVRAARRGELVAAERARVGAERSAEAGVSERELREARRLGLAVDRAARYGVLRTTCLVRSLALRGMLERAGITGALRVGVQRRGGTFRAHAWVEVGGQPLGQDGLTAREFEVADDIDVKAIHGGSHGRAGR